MCRVNSSKIFSARSVHADRKRKRSRRRAVPGGCSPPRPVSRHPMILVAACIVCSACKTVEIPIRPVTVTATAGPIIEPADGGPVVEPTQAGASLAPRLTAAPSATRGLWVVRSTLVHPDSVRAMVTRAADAGFNTLMVQVRGRGDAYYSGGIEPRADGLRDQPTFDPLALTVREAHARGLEVHAWMNVHLISSAATISRDPKHLVNKRPELLAVPRELARELYDVDPESLRYFQRLVAHALANRDNIEGLFSSPSAPEVKEQVYTIATDLVERYKIDGIHLDYVRYPSAEFDYSRGALDRFRIWVDGRITEDQRAEFTSASEQDPLAFVEAFPEPWADFRRNQITDLVERIYVGVKRRRPDVLVSAAVFPDARESFVHRYADWEGWLQSGIVDVVAPMAYNPDDELFVEAISRAAEVGGPERVWAGVGVYLTTYEGTLRKIDITRRLGVRGFLLFSYDWSVAFGATANGQPFLERVGGGFMR
jgi:uncharacterized lipoprotein YddW (UPF0748 family)